MEEDFTVIDLNKNYTDIALAVHTSKRIEYIIRKYFCNNRRAIKRSPNRLLS